ncbi:MAG: cytochrome b [Ectothiorhodospiraceae bacterium]
MAAATATGPRYTLIQRLLHWAVAVLVLLSLAIGLTLGYLGFEGAMATFGENGTNLLYTAHKTSGVAILGLMVIRLAARLTLGKPGHQPPLPRLHRIASEAVHGTLYLLLVAMPAVGWLATAAGGFPVQFFHWNLPGLIGEDKALSEQLFQWHAILGWVILALVAVHISAAIYHWRVRRDGVMRRMSLFR